MRLFLIFIYIFFSNNIYANNIVTINILKIIDDNKQYNNFLIKLNNKKTKFDSIISLQNTDILNSKEKLESDALLLSENILNDKINEFNLKIQNYQKKIENLDEYIKQNMIYNENIIMQSIAEITTQYAKDNNIDLILNENNYFIASNDIDISDLISNKLENINFNFLILNESEFFDD